MTQKATEQMEYRARAPMMRNGPLAKSAVGTSDLTMVRNVASATYEDAGDWPVDLSKDADGARHGMILYHCGFAVSRDQGTPRDAKFSLANQNILDLYGENLNRFRSLDNGAISAEGTMLCGNLGLASPLYNYGEPCIEASKTR
ncbi:hypothetical protein F5Y07DRAFT_407829 [Xylaria sp. FL0933]|nr:hypothetical protein F5Y07DRAFT_407829 [Xylaria sp. FL0933]